MKISVDSTVTATRLRTAMDRIGIKASELAWLSGVKKASISQYLNNSHTPSNISAEKMAKVLGVNMVWLMGFDVPMSPQGEIVSPEELSSLYRVYPVLEGSQNGVPQLAEKDLSKHVQHVLNIPSDFVMLIDLDRLCGKTISHGDIIFIRKEEPAAIGELVLLSVQDELMIKRIYRGPYEGSFILMDDTVNAMPKVLSDKERKNLHILGRIVAVQHPL